MNFQEIVEKLGLTAQDITAQTYFYIDDNDDLCVIEKFDRTSAPADEKDSLGYAVNWMFDLAMMPGEFTLYQLAAEFDMAYSTLGDKARDGRLEGAHKRGRQWFATRQAVLDLP